MAKALGMAAGLAATYAGGGMSNGLAGSSMPGSIGASSGGGGGGGYSGEIKEGDKTTAQKTSDSGNTALHNNAGGQRGINLVINAGAGRLDSSQVNPVTDNAGTGMSGKYLLWAGIVAAGGLVLWLVLRK